MKKLIAIVLVALMLIPVVVYSCDGTAVLPNMEADNMCGEVFVAVQSSTSCLYGKLSPSETVSVAPMQTASSRVRGITANGVNRAKGEMRYSVTEDGILGMTKVCASVTIYPDYAQTVTEIVRRCMGEEAMVTASSVVACTICRTSCTVTHRMVGRTSDKVAVGTVLFKGADRAAVLYVTDWDGDGNLDLAFSVNPGTVKTTTATPTPVKPSKKTNNTGCNKKCINVEITINIEKIMINRPNINIESIFGCGHKEGC